jgi:dihydrolipoamide dehydrogenase
VERKRFDIAVLGGGPGGYPAAIRAAQRGKNVALIEAREMGGTCLNRGCIPSKALIANAEILNSIQHANAFGIQVGDVSFDYSQMVKRKNTVVENIRTSLEGLITSNNITIIRGYGKCVSPRAIKVEGQDKMLIETDKIIIATGSEPRNMAPFPFDYERIHDSTSLLDLKRLPKSLAIIGGGVIGCEFASLYQALGVQVTILELLPRIIPMEAEEVSQALTRAFTKKGIHIQTGIKVEKVERTANGIEVKIEGGKSVQAEMALVSVGRQLNTDQIGLDKAGVLVENNGLIAVNERMETTVDGIYAVGDIASKWWLAHVASHQGVVAAENACGRKAQMHYYAIPSIIFTHPEIGTVGLSLAEALKQGFQAKVAAFPFQALGKSQAAMQTEGFAQIVVEEKTGQILGAQVVGYEASILTAEMALAIANELTIECLTETIHAHPTLSEAWLETGYLAEGFPIHLPPKGLKKRK